MLHLSTEQPGLITCEEHSASEHLGQDAARRPHVYGLGVVVGGEQQARRTVPLCHHAL